MVFLLPTLILISMLLIIGVQHYMHVFKNNSVPKPAYRLLVNS